MATQNNKSSTNGSAGTAGSESGGGVIGTARDATVNAYGSTVDAVSSASRRTGQAISGNPTIALAGGFALGALIGAVAPITRRERELLTPVGQKLTDTAREQARQAAEAGKQKMDQVTGQVVQKVGSAVVEAVGGKEG